MKSHQDAVHNPVRIDSAPLISSRQLSCRSLPLLAHLNDREFSKWKQYFSDPLSVVNLQSEQILNNQKNILSNKIHQLRIEKCPKTGPKSKNPTKFADIHRSDAWINGRSIKFNFKCCWAIPPFFFRLASNAFPCIGLVSRIGKIKIKKITKSLEIGGPGTSGRR